MHGGDYLSYWLYSKNSEGKRTVTSSNLLGWTGNGSWLGTIMLSMLCAFLFLLLSLFITSLLFKDPSLLLLILFPLLFFVSLGMFIYWFRPKERVHPGYESKGYDSIYIVCTNCKKASVKMDEKPPQCPLCNAVYDS